MILDMNTKIYLCILGFSFIAVSSTKRNYVGKSEEKALKEIEEKWNECCERHNCIANSCYFVEWSSSSWATMRQRCQNPYRSCKTDIFSVLKEKNSGIFWSMLQKPVVPVKGKQIAVWTGGVKCPVTTSNRITFSSRWVSTNEKFAYWLDKIINDQLPNSRQTLKGCEFLVMYPKPNDTDVKYEFQDQNAHYPAICEFILPGTVNKTGAEHPEDVTHSSTIQSIAKTTNVRTTVAKKTSEAAETTSEITTLSSTSVFRGSCQSIYQDGIIWPETQVGLIARAKCPKGMIGFAEWKCDENTFRFQPKSPNTENCKQQWVEDLQNRIRVKNDALDISTKLAEDTSGKNISHGDLIALVNLTSDLLTLYLEQKGEEEFEVSQNEEMPVYYNFTKYMVTSISNILRTEIKEAWQGLNETRQTREASRILKLVTTVGSRLSCIKTSDDKLQFTVSADNIDLQTFILNKTNEDVIVFPQQTEVIKPNSSIVLPTNSEFAKRFTTCKSYSSAVGVIYKHVGDFLQAGKLNSTSIVATKVLSFSLSNSTESISLTAGKVSITLQHLSKEDIQYQIIRNPRCVFWNFSASNFGAWDSSGCKLLSFNKTHTLCECDHLTNFAVLMDINDNVQNDDILTMMTYACCGFSSLALFLTLFCFFIIRSLHGRRSIITGNLCFSLLVTNVLIIFGIDKTQNKVLCSVVAGFLHYWILTAFCWMLVEGYHLYTMVILVFQRGSNIPVKYYYIFAYGTPLIVVGISAGIKKEGYGGEQYCWLSAKDGLMWSFVGPACAIILVNIVIFILTLRSASNVKIKREQSTIRKIKSWIRGSISVMCLLGLTWCIGLFYIERKLHFFSYVFTLLNGLQGVFIFLFHILLNDQVSRYCSSQGNQKHSKRKFLNHTSSNSKTSTKTSMNSIGCMSNAKLTDTGMKSNSPSLMKIYNAPNRSIVILNTMHENYKQNDANHSVSDNILSSQASLF